MPKDNVNGNANEIRQEAPKQPLHNQITYRFPDPEENEGGFYRFAQYINEELEKLDENSPRKALEETLLNVTAAQIAMHSGAGVSELYDKERMDKQRDYLKKTDAYHQIVAQMSDNEIIAAFGNFDGFIKKVYDREDEIRQEKEKTVERFKTNAAAKRRHTDLNTTLGTIKEVDEDEIENEIKNEQKPNENKIIEPNENKIAEPNENKIVEPKQSVPKIKIGDKYQAWQPAKGQKNDFYAAIKQTRLKTNYNRINADKMDYAVYILQSPKMTTSSTVTSYTADQLDVAGQLEQFLCEPLRTGRPQTKYGYIQSLKAKDPEKYQHFDEQLQSFCEHFHIPLDLEKVKAASLVNPEIKEEKKIEEPKIKQAAPKAEKKQAEPKAEKIQVKLKAGQKKQEESTPKSSTDLAIENVYLADYLYNDPGRQLNYDEPDNRQLLREIIRLKKAVNDQTATNEEKNTLNIIKQRAASPEYDDSTIFFDRQANINVYCLKPLIELTMDAKRLHYRLTEAIPRNKMSEAWQEMDDNLKKLADLTPDAPISAVKSALSNIAKSESSLWYDKSKFKDSGSIKSALSKMSKKIEVITEKMDNTSIRTMPVRMSNQKSLLQELDEAKAIDRELHTYTANQENLESVSEGLTHAVAWAKEQLKNSKIKKLAPSEASNDLKTALAEIAKADENTPLPKLTNQLMTATMAGLSLNLPNAFFESAEDALNELLNYVHLPDTSKSLKHNRDMIQMGGNYFDPVPAKKEPQVVQKQPQVVQEQPKVVQEQPKVVQEQPQVVQKQPKVVQEQPKVVQEQPKVVQEQPKVMPEQPKVNIINEAENEPVQNNIINNNQKKIPTADELGEMDLVSLVNAAKDLDRNLDPQTWGDQFPKRVPQSYKTNNIYTAAEVKAFDRTSDMQDMNVHLAEFSYKLNGYSFLKDLDEVGKLSINVAKGLSQTGEDMKNNPDNEKKWYVGMASLAALKAHLTNEETFRETMVRLTGPDMLEASNAQIGFVKFIDKLNTYCNAGIPISAMLKKTGFAYVAEAANIQIAANQQEAAAENANRKVPAGLDSRELKNKLTDSGPLNWGSSAEHRTLVDQLNAYNRFMTENKGRPDPEAHKKQLEALNKAAEEYVVRKRENHWNEVENWTPHTPSGENRFKAAMNIVKITREALGKGDFDLNAHNARLRAIDRVRYAPANERERKANLLKGRCDQFRIETEGPAVDKSTIAYEQNEIKKLLNDGMPKNKAAFERLKGRISKHCSSIITKTASQTIADKSPEMIEEEALLLEKTKNFQHLMAGANNWKGLVELSEKALLKQGKELALEFREIRKKDDAIKQNYQEQKNNELKKDNDIERTSSLSSNK